MAELLTTSAVKTTSATSAPKRPALLLTLWERAAQPTMSFLAIAAVLAAAWELYKLVGTWSDDTIPLVGWEFPVATNDLAMPHVGSILGALFEPTRRGDSEILLVTLLIEAKSTVLTAGIGLLAGSLAGCVLALVFAQVRMLSRSLLPWVVVSQTVPLVAIAPMIVIWGSKAGLPDWGAAAAIAMYLAFFPVTINTLRGLTSASQLHTELFRSWASTSTQTMQFLQIPGALAYVFAGLRLAATASVIGTVVGELSVGTGGGLGRAILNFSYFYSNGPEKLFAAVLVAAVVGMAFVAAVVGLERLVLRDRQLGSEPA